MTDLRRLAGVCCLAFCVVAGLSGCTSDGGVTYASVYEGLLGDEPAPSPTQAVAMMFDRDNADNRRKGVGWIASAPFGGEAEYRASYRLLADDPDPSVRAAVAKALGMHGEPADANLLAVLMVDDEPLVRWQAADGLRKIHNPEVVPSLLARLDEDAEEDADTRTASAMALGQYADRVVLSRLAGALEDRSFNVVNAAHGALIQLTGHDAGLDPRDWADWSASAADPFANQRPYTFQPYQPTRGWIDRYITFWNNGDDGPRQPAGLTKAE